MPNGPGLQVEAFGIGVVAASFTTASRILEARTSASVAHWGHMLETRIKRNASGRPGPNAPTGNYRRSWNTRLSRQNGLRMASVGTNMPQAQRLEYGFHGTDSLGRHYDQPAYPHVGPAVDSITPEFAADLQRILSTL